MKELIERATKINEELVAKLKELKELEEPNLLGTNGKYFTAKIGDNKTKGRIRVKDNDVYLCQDEANGRNCQDKFGYKYSYFIRKGTEDDLKGEDVTNLKLWDYLPKEGEYFYVKSESGFSYIAIAKNGEYLTSRFVSLDSDGWLNYDESRFVCSEPNIKELRPATTEEITLLDTKLKEKGKYFDQATMSIKDIVTEPAFKVGDSVLITKPKDRGQKPYWANDMGKYDGQTLEIEELSSGSSGYLVIDGWNFHPDWCKKVEAPKLKVGDWVLITKPKDVRQIPYWPYHMNKYDEQTLEIEEINSDGYLVINGWEFHPDWCTKVEAPKPNKPKVGDLCILWDDNKSNAIIGKLTKINKSDIPYEVGSAWSYMYCIKFKSMEQYNEFIEDYETNK